MKHSNGKGRIIVLLVLCAAMFAAYLGRLAWMQFTMADFYAEKAHAAANASYTYSTAAARGDITDRSGEVLAQDAPVYDLYLRWPAPPGTDLQANLQAALAVLQEVPRQDANPAAEGSKDVETQLAAFCSAVPAGEFLLAQGLSPDTAARLRAAGLEDSGALRLAARGERSWADGSLLPHALGLTGAITAEQWQADDYALKAEGYPMDGEIGQSGLEAAFEAELRAQNGRTLVEVDRRTGVTAETELQAPSAGRTLVLALDAGVQRAAKQALQAQMEFLRANKGAGQGREVSAGAVVVVDTQTGGILAAASLPGYDLAAYRTDYAALSSDAARPLFDRVELGLYAPGSAFKPAVAAAALSSREITPADTVTCTGSYLYYPAYQPRCLQLSHSGPVNLLIALQHSCNIYFYDVGRRLGVDAFSAAAQQLGLAADAGAELPAAKGRLTWSTDENYQAGLALQAAIGQGNTAVTPLQLASYACALANGGQRLRLHYAAAIRDTATGAQLSAVEPQVLDTLPGGEEVFGPVRQGMVAMSGTLLALRGLPVTLACKTGSPQRAERFGSGYYTNSVLIGYAPAEEPRIAVAVVLEYGGGGANAAPILRSVLDYFFT